uniref:Dynein regulatory complex protein 1 n=1 Tax=Bombyx mori TaxID=7091 RepID=A0A8R2R449_BOMMO|nr:dynein regulatory complex protein 1 isoform X2 [Bombyx mori]
MAGTFERYNDEEDDVLAPTEPQITSHDPVERKAARSLRIKRRQEALKRSEQQTEEIVADEDAGPIELATATAAEELQRLNLDGAAKVTNVKVTTDEREVLRRGLFADNMRDLMKKIEDEATEAQIQYEAITSNWNTMLNIKDPLDIDAEMKKQRQKCDFLMEQKNEVITELKNNLQQMDDAYYEDLDKQDKDIKELSDRIEKQVTIMQRAYEKQLSLIEQAIKIEREVMVDHNNKRWEALYKQRDKEELAHMEYRSKQLEEHKQEIEVIMWDHHEKFREAKIELESLIQELQRELEKLKATCIINTEKIGYNYQILKKREEENVFVRSQQKRKLNKMSDVANALRAKIRKAAEEGAIEEIKADAEIVKLMQTMDDLEKKSDQFKHVNDYKFCQIWRMATHRCSELSKELRQGEVALHAQVLAGPPPPPPPPLPKSPLSKYEQRELANKDKSNELTESKLDETKDGRLQAAKERLVRHILQLVTDNTGFLIENRLLKLIEKYQPVSRNLCTLDAIFMALDIQAEEDIEILCKTFLNYAFCPICVGLDVESDLLEPSRASMTSRDESHHASVSAKSTRGDRMSVRGRQSVVRSMSVSTTKSGHIGFKSNDLSPADQILMAEADEIIQKCGDLQVGHPLEIEPMQVLTALGEFIKIFEPPEKKKLFNILESVKPPDFSTPSRQLTTEEIEQYWTHWKNIFPAEKDRFWDGLISALNDYLAILQERECINAEVVVLRRRNAALRRLVRGALPELPAATPQYARQGPSVFTATFTDNAPQAFEKLPPI